MNGYWIAGGLGIGVGLLVFLMGRRWLRDHHAFRRRATRVNATIVALTGEDSDMPTVEFVDASGRTRRVEGRSNAGRGAAIGGPLVLFYDPQNPSDARLEQDMVASPFVAMLVGVVFAMIGVGMIVLGFADI